MVRALAACPGCRRHVAVQEPSCPFCLRVFAVGELAASHRIDGRLSRHATRFAQLLLGGAAIASCSANPPPGRPVAASAPTAATSARPPTPPSAPAPPAPPAEVPQRKNAIYGHSAIQMNDQITFDASSATIRPSTGPLLDEIATLLESRRELVVTLEGHATARECDGVGCDDLGKRRAEAVRAALVARGVHASRLRVVSFGATRPDFDPATHEGRNRNRRVTFDVVASDGGRSDATRGQPVPP